MYLRVLQSVVETGGMECISSHQLGAAAGVADAQVRKDLASIGGRGQSGVGYRTRELHETMRRAIGLQKSWRAVLVGAGNIGRALLAYPRFHTEGFELVAVFDHAPSVVGKRVAGLAVQPMKAIPATVRRSGAHFGIVAVPPSDAQNVAEILVASGIRGLLNFAPRALQLPAHVASVNVDFTEAFQRLAFETTNQSSRSKRTTGA